ncbi:MAG: NifB/NifX family molybdenum-iron cluster-binding protein [Desulfobacteraceae bacterium]|nr:NifB/NifX family molybdenum-iron cluster-binding protein [Desulfobacteraceae bacterium]
MKIAVPSRGSQIDNHFGHCDYFSIFTMDENKEITREEIIESPKECGCKSDIAAILAQLGVTTMLAGGMGEGAVRVLQGNGIKVIRGCSGDARQAAMDWINGRLVDSGIVCSSHECSSH